MTPTTMPSGKISQELLDDTTLWDMPRIADELRVQYQAVQNWRRKSRLAAEEDPENPPDQRLMPQPILGTLLWPAGQIRRWAINTGRMGKDGVPTHSLPPAPPLPNMAYRELVTDRTEWDLADIGLNLKVQRQTVKSWRRDSLVEQGPGTDPERLVELEQLDVDLLLVEASQTPHPNRLPLPHRYVFGKPVWRAGVVRLWAMQTGRMLPDGVPVRGKPPGRPRKLAA